MYVFSTVTIKKVNNYYREKNNDRENTVIVKKCPTAELEMILFGFMVDIVSYIVIWDISKKILILAASNLSMIYSTYPWYIVYYYDSAKKERKKNIPSVVFVFYNIIIGLILKKAKPCT